MENHKCIYKYPLEITDSQIIELKQGCEFLCLKEVCNIPTLYYLINPSNEFKSKTIRIFGTGHFIPAGELSRLIYLGTVVCNNGQLIWHVFEKLP